MNQKPWSVTDTKCLKSKAGQWGRRSLGAEAVKETSGKRIFNTGFEEEEDSHGAEYIIPITPLT
jgi:hypothetical protein